MQRSTDNGVSGPFNNYNTTSASKKRWKDFSNQKTRESAMR